jgi:dihydrofolate reductase
MGTLTYGMNVSLDGYTTDREGGIDWTVPDAEQHQYWNDLTATLSLSLYGRKLWDTMSAFWPTADQDPDASAQVVEFAQRWRSVPKVVFSQTLAEVSGNARLERGDVVEVARRLKEETDGLIEVGGATLAGPLVRAGLVDEVRVAIMPTAVGGGTPFLPPLDELLRLELVETRTFPSGTVLHHYVVMHGRAGT